MFSSDIIDALPEFKELAESMMLERVRISRETGVEKDADGRTTPKWEPVYEGRAGLSATLEPATAEVTGATVTIEQLTLRVPTSTPYLPAIDDLVEFIAGSSANLFGINLRVYAPSAAGSLSLAHRVPVERIVP